MVFRRPKKPDPCAHCPDPKSCDVNTGDWTNPDTSNRCQLDIYASVV